MEVFIRIWVKLYRNHIKISPPVEANRCLDVGGTRKEQLDGGHYYRLSLGDSHTHYAGMERWEI